MNAVNFSITQSNTICIVYVIDSYRPVAGEITLAVTGFKGTFHSLLVHVMTKDFTTTNKDQPYSPSFSPLKQIPGSTSLATRTHLEPWRELRGESSLCGSPCISGESKFGITRGNGASFHLYTGITTVKWESNYQFISSSSPVDITIKVACCAVMIKEASWPSKRDTPFAKLADKLSFLRSAWTFSYKWMSRNLFSVFLEQIGADAKLLVLG